MPDARDSGQGDGRAVPRALGGDDGRHDGHPHRLCGGSQAGEPPSSPAGQLHPGGRRAPPSGRGRRTQSGVTLCQHVGDGRGAPRGARGGRAAASQPGRPRHRAGQAAGGLRRARSRLTSGPFEDQLETPLTRLGYRLDELELAVEDFRTNSRPQQAVTHVETDALTFGSELGRLRHPGALLTRSVEGGADLAGMVPQPASRLGGARRVSQRRAPRRRASGPGCAGGRARGRRPRRARRAAPG